MKVNLKSITPDAEKTIVEIARVSSSRKNKGEQLEGLINYLIRHSHWSPFEHGYMTMEIETSKAIGIQLIRHRSFTFQEFSQRYQDVSLLGEGNDIFEPIELREQAQDNRQSSTEVFDPEIKEFYTDETVKHFSSSYKDAYKELDMYRASVIIDDWLQANRTLYKKLLEAGVAREQARMILPMCTKTRIYMTGSIRSWIHFLSIRDDGHAQKEIQDIAKAIKEIFVKELPIISNALNYGNTSIEG